MEIKAVNWTHPTRYFFFSRSTHKYTCMHTYIHTYIHTYAHSYTHTYTSNLLAKYDDDDDGIAAELILKFKTIII